MRTRHQYWFLVINGVASSSLVGRPCLRLKGDLKWKCLVEMSVVEMIVDFEIYKNLLGFIDLLDIAMQMKDWGELGLLEVGEEWVFFYRRWMKWREKVEGEDWSYMLCLASYTSYLPCVTHLLFPFSALVFHSLTPTLFLIESLCLVNEGLVGWVGGNGKWIILFSYGVRLKIDRCIKFT